MPDMVFLYKTIFTSIIMVSIIIPVYNTGRILNKCLRSVLIQTYEDWECIIVDDCSTDKETVALLDKWKEKDERFHLIVNKQNLGIERNRFVGLAEVKGEFVMFMDHDDWLYDKFSLQHLVNNAYKTNADVVIGNHAIQFGIINRHSPIPVPPGVIRQPELKDKYYVSYFGVNIIPVFVWARLYRKSLIEKAQMKPHGLRYADDVAWNIFIMPYAESVSIIPETVYVHRWGGLSSTSSRALDEYKLFYQVRREAIVRFDYPEARKWLDIEMKNILFEHLRQQMDILGMKNEDIREGLIKELDAPIWKDIIQTLQQYCYSEFSKALISKDVDVMCELVQRHVCSFRERMKRVVKKVLHKII